MITSFGHFRSFRETTTDPCVEVQFVNNVGYDQFFQFTSCDGVPVVMDLAGGETSINYCATDNSWTLDPGITVTIIGNCLNDGDVTTPEPPSPPAPSPAPSPAPTPTPSPSPNPKGQL